MRGSIRQRGDKWELRVRAGWDADAGRYRQVSRTFDGNKRDAQRALRELIGQVEQGEVVPTSVLTFSMLVDRWLEQVENRLAATTLRTYRAYIDHHIQPTIGEVSVSDLTTAALNDLYRNLGKKGLAPASIRQVHAIIRRACRFGVSEQYGGMTINVAAGATLPYQSSSDIHPPEPAAVAKLLRAAEEMDPGFGMLCRVTVASGARRGELCALRWSDVNFTTGVLQIRQAHAVTPGKVVEKSTKTHQWRKLRLDEATLDALRAWRQIVDDRAAFFETKVAADAYLFSKHPAGVLPIHPDSLTASWRRVVRKVGVECRFHDLRHFNATQLLAAGVPVRTVSGRLGHRLASTTTDIYAHWVPESDNEAADIMGRILGGGG